MYLDSDKVAKVQAKIQAIKKHIVLFVFITVVSSPLARAFYINNLCAEALTNVVSSYKIKGPRDLKNIENLFSYFTRGFVPNIKDPFQVLAFEMYRLQKFGPTDISLRPNTLPVILETLAINPELTKQPFREYRVVVKETKYPVTKKLSKFINSHLRSSGQIKANLFRIEDNLGYWKKILDYKTPPEFESSDKKTKRILLKKSQEHFRRYLDGVLPASLIVSLDDEATSVYSKINALYYYLFNKREELRENNQNIRPISQAIVDLIHTVGFHDKVLVQVLKSGDGVARLNAFNKILERRNDLARMLNYRDFNEVLSFFEIYGPTGVENQKKFVDQLDELEDEVVAGYNNGEKTATKTKTVRHLSLMESPYRSCVGGNDCSSLIYLPKALDPNYHYFTLTDEKDISDGQVVIVLGEASYNNKKIKVAFIDKVQNVDTANLKPMLEAIRRSVKEQGYILAIPTYLGTFAVGFVSGITNYPIISEYLENSIEKDDLLLKSFVPHPNNYKFFSGTSRANDELDLKPVSAFVPEESENIVAGSIVHPWKIDFLFDIDQVIKEFSSPNNLSLETKKMFILASDYMIKSGLYKYYEWTEEIIKSWKENEDEPAELRKIAAEYLDLLNIAGVFKH